MRADRLLSILMLLQSRGKMSAQKLAQELEVSDRTIYRDLEALSAAGVPVYTQRGPGGGCSLLECYRTNLTGLTDQEIEALFMLSIPTPLVQLGVSEELRTAMLKIAASLPAGRPREESKVRQSIYLDPDTWSQAGEPVPFLQVLQGAIRQQCYLNLGWISFLNTEVRQRIAPYGLVAKANTWYLVGEHQGTLRVIQVFRLVRVEITEDQFERPADFDLPGFWKAWCKAAATNRQGYPVLLRVSPGAIPLLRQSFGANLDPILAQASSPDASGWIRIQLTFESLEMARERILGLGRSVEVIEPAALRKSIIDFAAQISILYTARENE